MVKEILEGFKEVGVSQAALERIFGLGQGDLSKEEKPETIALMRIIATYPWLINVAENNYEANYARRALVHVAIDTLLDTHEHAGQHTCSCKEKQEKVEQKNEDVVKS